VHKGWLEGEDESAFLSDRAGCDDGLDALGMSSITYRIAKGGQAGRKLAALVPPPRAHLTRFHRVFAPNAALRAKLTPSGRGKRPLEIDMVAPHRVSDEPNHKRNGARDGSGP